MEVLGFPLSGDSILIRSLFYNHLTTVIYNAKDNSAYFEYEVESVLLNYAQDSSSELRSSASRKSPPYRGFYLE